MKAKIFLFAVICALLPFSLFSRKGEQGNGGISIASFRMAVPPITLELFKNSVVVYYNIDLGNVTTTVKNSMGAEVYKKVVDTSYDYSLTINIANLSAGNYTFIFTDTDGGNISTQSFQIE